MAGGRDFFISYTSVNRPWAEWIMVELERLGFTTFIQALDITPGTDFVHEMQQAAATAARTIAVISPAYFASRFGEAEWRAAFATDPSGELGRLLPVRVQLCEPPGLLASRVYVDLVDTDEGEARRRLAHAVQPGPRPAAAPFPAARAGSRFPGFGPDISNLQARSRNFSGRDGALTRLSAELRASSAEPAMVAVHGLGGVGKTQLALEYAHHFAADYDLIWWVPADRLTSAVAAIIALADRLAVPAAAEEGTDQTERIGRLFDLLRGRNRWLLVYDDVEAPERLNGLVPAGGGGHVLVTSRWPAWGRYAAPYGLDVLPREESVVMLRRRVSTDGGDELLRELAELLGDLPLALEEAAAYLDETQEDVADYIALVRDRTWDLFGLGEDDNDVDTERRLATVWTVSLDRVRAEAPGADRLLSLLAVLAPHVPRTLLHEYAAELPLPLAGTLRDRVVYNRTLAAAGRYSLVTLTAGEVSMHPLVQVVVRNRLAVDAERSTAAAAVDLIRAAFPADVSDVANWPECARLLPHILAVTDHAERMGIAGEPAGWLLEHASAYLRERAQYRQAVTLAERAVAIGRTSLGQAHPELARHHDELGRARQDLGEFAGAREQYEQALRIGQAALGSDHEDVGVWRNNLGNVLHDLGELEAARLEYEVALRIGEAALGPDHPTVGIRRNNLGAVLHDQRDLAGARDQYERALRISESVLGPDHPTVGTRRSNLGAVLRDLGDLSGARTEMESALRISEAALGPEHPTVGIRRGNLGMLLRDLGDLTTARTYLEEALRIGEASRGLNHPDVGIWHNNLGNVLQDLGDLASARECYERALRITAVTLGPRHATVALLLNNYATVLQGLGMYPAAGQVLRLVIDEQ